MSHAVCEKKIECFLFKLYYSAQVPSGNICYQSTYLEIEVVL